ncbi:o-succinylbenzoate synthase [Robiginitalea sediminis]|uniref:o-succinylbenzoate synthase n=1 Tax=Robiginitalea sediminis TaxID=1982593 RepID=UPI000B4BF38D|nr:o-succinylbenzoate synthase [Robiginitalea sediminis]
MKATHRSYQLHFKRPGGTSRGVLTQKETHLLLLEDAGATGIGECGLFLGLSADDRPGYDAKLDWVCKNTSLGPQGLAAALEQWPSIRFGVEQAFRSLASEHPMVLFPSRFLEGEPLPINGLIWMGTLDFMQEQIEAKLAEGNRCLKLKIGALGFEEELSLLHALRKRYSSRDLELRVDANGAFSPGEALERLKALADLDLHSIEQPIAAGQREAMATLCSKTPLPIALDEELIGVFPASEQAAMLDAVAPQYIILKPSLVGGYAASEQWIRLAQERGIGWWVTSALESNIGLNAIAQWTATLNVDMPQGLGTGSLFTNNFESPLYVEGGYLRYDNTRPWRLDKLEALCT